MPTPDLTRLSERVNRLLDRLMVGGCVPFLGSGVSGGARSSESADLIPTIKDMTERLSQMVTSLGQCEPERTPEIAEALGLGSGAPSFDRLCEVLSWYRGHEAIVDALEIHHYATLSTQPAHRFIARLAREGLVAEAITTNYDTCLERAFGDTGPATDTCEGTAFPIRDLGEYRRRGASRFSIDGAPCLRVYKINGCAEKLADARKSDHSDRRQGAYRGIILTERQLQGFGAANWALEMLKDRARSRAFVFTGFGSDEPKIRHTILELTEEFGRDGAENGCRDDDEPGNGQGSAQDCWSQGNAPFVAAFGAKLTYPQLQLIHAYWRSHRPEVDPTLLRLDVSSEANIFLGGDCKHFPPYPADATHFPADTFWRGVYLAAMGRLLTKQLAWSEEFHRWLVSQGVGSPNRPVQSLRRWLFPGQAGDDAGWRQSLFGAQPWLWEEICQGCEESRVQGQQHCEHWRAEAEDTHLSAPSVNPTLRLHLWLSHIRGEGHQGSSPAVKDPYLPLSDDRLLILSLLLLLRCLSLGAGDPGEGEAGPSLADAAHPVLVDSLCSPDLGLLIPLPKRCSLHSQGPEVDAHSTPRYRYLSLITENHSRSAEVTLPGGVQGGILRVILPSSQWHSEREVVRDEGGHSGEGIGDQPANLRVARITTISASSLFKELSQPSVVANESSPAEGSMTPFLRAFFRVSGQPAPPPRRARLIPLSVTNTEHL